MEVLKVEIRELEKKKKDLIDVKSIAEIEQDYSQEIEGNSSTGTESITERNDNNN